MPLSQPLLKKELQNFCDPLFPSFAGHPENKTDMAHEWSNAIDKFIKDITPVVSLTLPAKEAFRNNMLTQVPPIPNRPYYEPFTLGYRSPENSLFLFNKYLGDIGYRSNPALDTDANLGITKAIRLTYNIAYPNRALTEDDIRYNQSRHNEIYNSVITNRTPLPLPKVSPFPESGWTQTYEDGRLITGPLDRLQVDGKIGDDTILYNPFIVFNEIQRLDKITGQSAKSQFIAEYQDTVEAQPSDSGDISYLRYTKGIHSAISKDVVYFKYIKTNKVRDTLKSPLSKTQSDSGETNWALDSGGRSDSKGIAYYKKAFEVNHAKHDPFWTSKHITTIAQFNTLMRLPSTIYKAAPVNKTDSIKLLEDSLLIHAQNIALGMLPTYTAAAPPVKIDLTPVVTLGNQGGTSEQVVDLLSTLILTWFKTGIATNNATGVTTPWL